VRYIAIPDSAEAGEDMRAGMMVSIHEDNRLYAFRASDPPESFVGALTRDAASGEVLTLGPQTGPGVSGFDVLTRASLKLAGGEPR
jgi:hypothetical protein